MEEAFLVAVEEGFTCAECKHCQQNKKVPERIIDWSCYHEDNMQQHLHNRQSMSITAAFLCNRFENEEK